MPTPAARSATPAGTAGVVFLTNFLAPNLIAVAAHIDALVGRFTVLVSVPVESNRQWQPEWGDLDVVVQRTKTITRTVDHPGGYREVNYIHLPYRTIGELRGLRPDVVVSLELGARSVLANLYARFVGRCGHVILVNASQRSEAGRGGVRRWLRRRLLRAADVVSFNGPSCYRYLIDLGCDPDRMVPWDYAADPRKPYRGPLLRHDDGPVRLLTVGQWIQRKGVLPAAQTLIGWAQKNLSCRVVWTLAGGGPQGEALRSLPLPPNLTLDLHDHCEPDQLQDLYRSHDVLWFPTLGDEWGLVVDEALHSGLIVIGSRHSQAAEVLIRDGVNGWLYTPEHPSELPAILDRLRSLTADDRFAMRQAARRGIADRTPQRAAGQFVAAVDIALAKKTRR